MNEAAFSRMRDDLLKDIRSVGKELALDIVQLNRKIELKYKEHNSRLEMHQDHIDKYDKRT